MEELEQSAVGREATCLICDGTGPLRPGQGGTLVCVEDCTVGREATCKHPEPITNRKGVTACMDCLTILSPPPTAGREASAQEEARERNVAIADVIRATVSNPEDYLPVTPPARKTP